MVIIMKKQKQNKIKIGGNIPGGNFLGGNLYQCGSLYTNVTSNVVPSSFVSIAS